MGKGAESGLDLESYAEKDIVDSVTSGHVLQQPQPVAKQSLWKKLWKNLTKMFKE